MLFRLLKFVWIVSLLELLPSSSFAEETASAYRGPLRGLDGQSIKYAAIRSDSRYLFFSSGSASWNVIDLLDGVRVGSAQSLEAPVRGLFLDGDKLLVVVTTSGVQHFDVEEVFEPEETTYEYERPTSAETDVFSSCMNKNGRLYLLELDNSNQRHIVRTIGRSSQQDSELSWSSLFTGSVPDIRDLLPVSILCGENRVHVVSAYFESEPEERHIASLSLGASPSVTNAELSNLNYSFEDVILSADGRNILHRQSKIFDEDELDDEGRVINPQKTDSRLIATSETSPGSGLSVDLGSGGISLASFFKGESVYYAAFVEQDVLESVVNPPLNQFLSVARSNLAQGISFGQNRYSGLESAGSQIPSQWFSTPQDHYAYGLVENQGLVRVSSAPSLEFVEDPGVGTLSGNSNLDFELRSSSKVNYEIRIDENFKKEGEQEGISTNYGKKVASGVLQAAQPKEISLSLQDLNIKRNASHSLVVFAKRSSNEVFNNVARLGLLFNFDPPPAAVKGLRLSYGDSSIRVHWYSDDASQDLSHYLVYLSYSQSLLSGDLPSSNSELESDFRQSILGLAGKEFSSPIEVEAAGFSGSVDLAPLENERTLYVRVQAVDEGGQLSQNNPAQVSERPRRTRSLVTALGGSNSCSIQASADYSRNLCILLMILLGLVFRQKKWAQRLRNRRGGD